MKILKPNADPLYPGDQAANAVDRAYTGSRYAEVREAAFANPYTPVWRPGQLPVYDVTLRSLVRGLLPFGKPSLFKQATERMVDVRSDLRWGANREGNRRLLHPNGAMLFGTWHVSEETPYSGYFRKGSRAVVAARYSTCCGKVARGQSRSLSLVAKLYPTDDPQHKEPLEPASLITQEDLGGNKKRTINECELRNAPDTHLFRRPGFTGPLILALTGLLFKKVDKVPAERQLYEIAELGLADGEAVRAPRFLRLLVHEDQPRIDGDRLDFRDEVLAQMYDADNPEPQRKLVFDIDVTDDGRAKGLSAFQTLTFENWRRIGQLVFHEGVVSRNGDYVIQFPHPRWRDDRNDPSTAVRRGR